jgi:hypothetical protein
MIDLGTLGGHMKMGQSVNDQGDIARMVLHYYTGTLRPSTVPAGTTTQMTNLPRVEGAQLSLGANRQQPPAVDTRQQTARGLPAARLENVMRWLCRAASVGAFLVAFVLCSSAASATDVGHFSGEQSLGPYVITDLPCLEGTEFTLTGSRSFIGAFVASDGFFHFVVTNQFSSTLVPVDGQGPTYVESGNVDHITFTTAVVPAGARINQTRINNDRFIGYVNGKVVASATIRIHQVEHFVGVDTDGDGVPDTFTVSVTINDVSCPAA